MPLIKNQKIIMETEREFNYDKASLTNCRGAEEYQKDLGFDIETMKGKKVLDIGAGGGKFQKEAKERGVNVISIDPSYDFTNVSDEKKNDRENRLDNYNKKYVEMKLSKEPGWKKNKVAAVNEALPFKENSFDFVLANYSSFHYLFSNYSSIEKGIDMAFLMLEEIYRVLKPGGEAGLELQETVFGNDIAEGFNKKHPETGCQFNSWYNSIVFKKPLEISE